ncbi:hypothetical protein CBM2633_U30001 [Cupriavidus taiwanensis]|nr:hypothetical protein CBM2633_U30001 [Cupriavidus taiwanensis]
MVGGLTSIHRALKPFGQVAVAIPGMALYVCEANWMGLTTGGRSGCGKASDGNQVIYCDAVLGHLGLYPKNHGSALP